MFDVLNALPADPILGLMQRFREDPNPYKVDLGVGVYKDSSGATPIMAAIKQAQQHLLNTQTTLSYVAPAGNAQFVEQMKQLAFGQDLAAISDRVQAVQTPGGCGALRVLAELIKAASPETKLWVSNPTWGNHVPLLGSAGLQLEQYPYLAADNRTLDWPAMQAAIARVQRGDIVLLHACCHNPTGVDLNLEQWQWLTEAALKQGFIPFVDMAYQGFGEGVDEDAAGLRYMAARLPEMLLAVSCSKNFGVYRERTGLACLLGANTAASQAALSHLLTIVRGIYSMPPNHGAALVAEVLSNPAYKEAWYAELTGMREYIQNLRQQLSAAMAGLGHGEFGFVEQQRGMFSYLGISEAQVAWLAKHKSIYMLGSSRASIAGLSQGNLEYVSSALAEALTSA